MKRLIVLRPEPGSSATVKRARERGLDALSVPLFEIEPLAWKVPDAASFDGLLITSANAFRHGGEGLHQLRGLPVHAVGAATADAAREAGFDIARTGDAGVDRLLSSLEPRLKLLHPGGEERRGAHEARQTITAIPVYRAKALDADVRPAQGAVALVHSPRAAQYFATLVDEAGIGRDTVGLAAISAAAAEAAGDGWAETQHAESPDDEALLALAERLCNKR